MLLESHFLSISLSLCFSYSLSILFVSVLSLPHLQETEVQPPPADIYSRSLLCTCSCITHLCDSLILFRLIRTALQTVTPRASFPPIKSQLRFRRSELLFQYFFLKEISHSSAFCWLPHSQHNQVGVREWVSAQEIGWFKERPLLWFSHKQMI